MASVFGLLLAFVLLGPDAAAQFRVGIVGGVNASAFDATAGADIDGAAGAHVGVFVDVGDAPIALRVGATYVSAGTLAAVPLQTELRPDPLGDQGADIEDAGLGTAVAFSVAGGVLFPLGPRSQVFGEIRYVADVSGFTDEARIDPDGPAGPFSEVTVESYQINLFSLRVGLLF